MEEIRIHLRMSKDDPIYAALRMVPPRQRPKHVRMLIWEALAGPTGADPDRAAPSMR